MPVRSNRARGYGKATPLHTPVYCINLFCFEVTIQQPDGIVCATTHISGVFRSGAPGVVADDEMSTQKRGRRDYRLISPPPLLHPLVYAALFRLIPGQMRVFMLSVRRLPPSHPHGPSSARHTSMDETSADTGAENPNGSSASENSNSPETRSQSPSTVPVTGISEPSPSNMALIEKDPSGATGPEAVHSPPSESPLCFWFNPQTA